MRMLELYTSPSTYKGQGKLLQSVWQSLIDNSKFIQLPLCKIYRYKDHKISSIAFCCHLFVFLALKYDGFGQMQMKIVLDILTFYVRKLPF